MPSESPVTPTPGLDGLLGLLMLLCDRARSTAINDKERHMSESEYYSDAALAKQAAIAAARAVGKEPALSLYGGFLERRVPPTPAEHCNCCGLDARDDMGGEVHHGLRWCYICLGRGHHEDLDADDLERIRLLLESRGEVV